MLRASKSDPPVGAIIVNSAVKNNAKVEWGNVTSMDVGDGVVLSTGASIIRYLARSAPQCNLYGDGPLSRTEVDHWLSFTMGQLACPVEFQEALKYLESSVKPKAYLVSGKLSAADYAVFGGLFASGQWQGLLQRKEATGNVLGWYNFIGALPEVKKIVSGLPKDAIPKAVALMSAEAAKKSGGGGGKAGAGAGSAPKQTKDEGKFVDLPGAEQGKVVVRFPPEASGYLHIGHAKAAMLNQHYRDHFQGKLILRFDDTNPAKEKEEFEEVIQHDLKLLHVKHDHFSRTSDHFELMLGYCEKLLKEGKAYVDDTDAETMKAEREAREESKNRNNSPEQNLKLWQEMKKGTARGQECAVRAKINMKSDNGCMRDPTIYRCKPERHPATGTKYKVYPTYDFACPIVDSIEGVTHALRTTEYMDRDDQFFWFIDALGLRKPHIYAYARLSMTNTVMSKRKLTWFVDSGKVDGWDDPRFPTVRGILRRGMTIEALKQFIIAQGSSRSVVFMEWDKIWAMNKKVVDPVAPRYSVVDGCYNVPVNIAGVQEEMIRADKHPKNPGVGQKDVWRAPTVLVDGEDAQQMKEGENVTFINWGNITIKSIKKEGDKVISVEAVTDLDNKDYKKTLKVTWLAKTPKADFIPTTCVYYDHIITKPVLDKDDDFKQYIGENTKTEIEVLGDPELVSLKKGDIIQVQRKGFFIVDVAYKAPSPNTCKPTSIKLISIPDGTPGSYGPPGKTAAPSKAAPTPAKAAKGGKKGGGGAKQQASNNAASSEATKPTGILADAVAINATIVNQGDLVRKLKGDNASQDDIKAAVTVLLELKAKYKSATGQDWKPGCTPPAASTPASATISAPADDLDAQISAQGDQVRKLKGDNAGKAAIDAEVKKLLDLKAKFKEATGKDWKPKGQQQGGNKKEKSKTPEKSPTPAAESAKSDLENDLHARITAQGDLVRKLKADKADPADVAANVQILLGLKDKFKEKTGQDWKPAGGGGGGSAKKEKKPQQQKQKPQPKKEEKSKGEAGQKVTRLGMEAKKEENLADWYSQVIVKAEMLEYYDVSGCYILRPWSYNIWEAVQKFFDANIKKLGVQNCYFPIFVSHAALEREKDHIADFAPEVAWVTKSGDSDLAEHIAIRPTSETVMYPAYAKWIQSYRDLPIKLNQWNNVVRWEFKHPQPFLRTREFLWQEGHTAYANKPDAEKEVMDILDLYRAVYEDIMAIPVVPGRKTEKEKFAGGEYTTTVEAYIASAGRAIQGATSHHLGQNFSKMFDVVFEHPETGEKQYVYQNSWGITTRTIGVLTMVHGDNQGLVLPPQAASIQVVIVPCGITANLKEEDRKNLYRSCEEYEDILDKAEVRVKGDYRENYSPGWKFNHWELKGVPIRIELGPRDIKNGEYVAVRRDTGEKVTLKKSSLASDVSNLLLTIQSDMFSKAKKQLDDHLSVCDDWAGFISALDKSHLIQSPFCGVPACEESIKEDSKGSVVVEEGAPSMGAKSLCIPFKQPKKLDKGRKCVHPKCGKEAKYYTMFGRSY